jgi:hypothetical protein
MISPDLLIGPSGEAQNNVMFAYLQIGICIGLSFVSTYKPASFKAWTTATLAWNRFMPYPQSCLRKRLPGTLMKGTHLEPLTRMMIQGSIVVEDVDKVELVPHAYVIIVRIVRRSDFHSSCPKRHIDHDGVGNDWHAAIKERMLGEFSVQVLGLQVRNETFFSIKKVTL